MERYAAACKQIPERQEIVKRLLTAGADPNAMGRKHRLDALSCCAELGYCKSMQILLDHGADDVNTALINAASMNRIECITILLKAGAQVNFLNNSDSTPLSLASRWGHTGAVRLLLENGADINSVDDNGNTAIHEAAYKGHHKVAEVLIKQGCLLNIRNKKGYSPLLVAIAWKRVPVADLILSSKKDVDIDAVNIHGNSALSLAELYGFKILEKKIFAHDVIQWRINKSNASSASSLATLPVFQGLQDLQEEEEEGERECYNRESLPTRRKLCLEEK